MNRVRIILLTFFLMFCASNIFADGAKIELANVDALHKTVSVDFLNAELKNVLKVFTQQTGINFVMDNNILDIKISLFLEDISISEALDSIAEAYNLEFYQIPDTKIFSVKPKSGSDEQKRMITKVYKLKYIRVSMMKLMQRDIKSEEEFKEEAESTILTRKVSSSSGSTTEEQKGILNALLNVLSEKGTLTFDERSNMVIITDFPDRFERIEHIIAALDRKLNQILIKAELIEITDSLDNIFGMQYNDGSETLWGASATMADRTHGFPWQRINRGITKTDLINNRDINLGVLSAENFSFVLKALDTSGEAKYLSRPRLMTLDGEPALIDITSDSVVTKLTQLDTETNQQQTTYERADTGILLRVTPYISGDDEDITMLVEPSVIRPVASAFFPADEVVDLNRRLVRTNVRVHDGDTIAIGGLLSKEKTEALERIPFLGSLPLIGSLFGNKEKTGATVDLLIFITPMVVTDSNSANLHKKKQDDWMLMEEEKPKKEGKFFKNFLKHKKTKSDKSVSKVKELPEKAKSELVMESDIIKKINEYKAVAAKNQNDPIAHSNLGVAYSKAGEYDEAIEEFKKSILLDPNSGAAYNNLGNLYRIKKEYNSAIACLKKAVQLVPDHPYAYTTLGLCYEMRDMIDEAKTSYLSAIRYAPDSEWTNTARERLSMI